MIDSIYFFRLQRSQRDGLLDTQRGVEDNISLVKASAVGAVAGAAAGAAVGAAIGGVIELLGGPVQAGEGAGVGAAAGTGVGVIVGGTVGAVTAVRKRACLIQVFSNINSPLPLHQY